MCVVLTPETPRIAIEIEGVRRVGALDVMILADTSASAGPYIGGLRRSMTEIVAPALVSISEDARIGVASFVDFPVTGCGESDDLPFRMEQWPTGDLRTLQTALDGVVLYSGAPTDSASNVEALYQLATGAGLEPWVRVAPRCPAGSRGYACFRDSAQPVVLHFGDSPFHNGPGGSFPYGESCPPVEPSAHDYADAVDALVNLGARVLSFHPTGVLPETLVDLEALAHDTGSTGADDAPLVFDLGSESSSLATAVVLGLATYGSETPVDLDTVLIDPDPTDDLDPRALVARVVALEAAPAAGVTRIDRERGVFVGVTGSTRVIFGLELRLPTVAPTSTERYRLRIDIRANARAHIQTHFVDIVIPGADGGGCDL